MQQSSVIFFTLFAAFIIFITQKGELPVYLGLLLLSPANSGGSSTSSTTNTSSVADTAKTVAALSEFLA